MEFIKKIQRRCSWTVLREKTGVLTPPHLHAITKSWAQILYTYKVGLHRLCFREQEWCFSKGCPRNFVEEFNRLATAAAHAVNRAQENQQLALGLNFKTQFWNTNITRKIKIFNLGSKWEVTVSEKSVEKQYGLTSHVPVHLVYIWYITLLDMKDASQVAGFFKLFPLQICVTEQQSVFAVCHLVTEIPSTMDSNET